MIQPSFARLGSLGPTGPRLLVVGHGALLGASQQGVRGGGLSGRIAGRARGEHGERASVDVLWNPGLALRSLVSLSSAGRPPDYDAIVVVVEAQHLLAMGRRLQKDLSSAWPSENGAPRVVLVLASGEIERGAATRAENRIHDIAAAAPSRWAPAVLHVEIDWEGELQDPSFVTDAVLQMLGFGSPAEDDLAAREVAVDRSLRALRGRTSHLRRALVLAQNSFDVPFAQLNLVSRGTLRSLAFIGRSSDGLERSLSAEAVELHRPLLVADTRQIPQFSEIPEIHGPGAIRYYVGHPVRARSGHAVGVLCVLDTEPHSIEPGDDVLIRDLALLAEGELAALTEHA